MRKIICLAIFAGFSAVGLTAQDINVTFTGTGDASVVESVTATNLATN